MSLWTTTRFHVRFHRARYLTHSYPLSRAGSGANTLSFLSPIAITSVARSAGLFVQPSPDAPSGWLVLSALFGLPITLWAYKCLMLVVFQRKVIYMGYAPPGSRTESLEDIYPKYTPKGIHIEELSISGSQSNTMKLSTLLLRRHDAASPPKHVVLYFQGNAGNPLHRIPVFAALLNAVPSLAILAPAPRSYWTSSAGRPTQAGLTADYDAALAFAACRFPTSRLTIYGHSLGASIALCLLASRKDASNAAPAATVHGLVLENAFTSVPDMVRALYPQRWLPYRYLGPFVRDKWDARAAAAAIAYQFPQGLARRTMVLVSERDEVVPPAMGREISGLLLGSRDMDGRRESLGRFVVLEGALHEDAWRYRDWTRAMKQYLDDLERNGNVPCSNVTCYRIR